MKKQIVSMTLAAAMAIGMTVPAAADTVIPDPQTKDEVLSIAFVPASMNTYYSLVLDGVKEEIDRYGGDEFARVDVYAPTSEAQMVEQQISTLETLLLDPDLDALFFSTHNDTEFIPYLEQFCEKGIPVYLFNMPSQDVSNDAYVSLVSYDFHEAGRLCGEWIKENVATELDEVKMLYLEGIEGTHNTVRTEGFMEGLEGADNVEIVVSQCAQWTREGGQNITENALQSNPEINCVFGPYDEMPLGAITALKDAGRLDDVVVVGYDGTEDGVNAIRAGEMAASVNTDPKQMGNLLIDTVVAHECEGKEVEKAVLVELKMIDSTNVAEIGEDAYGYVQQEKSKEIER
ncbi:MAG: sugar ABC transporter substrate-binding protein [Blautia sp.]|nr:sugar ABC transporter substrate-binding protein [Blautia sp.]